METSVASLTRLGRPPCSNIATFNINHFITNRKQEGKRITSCQNYNFPDCGKKYIMLTIIL
jgi:hypothetical protein